MLLDFLTTNKCLFMRLLLLPLLFLSVRGFAQSIFSPGLSLITEYSINQFDTEGMNGFVNSFNDFWGSRLSKPYQEFSGNEFSHMNYGIGFRVISTGKVGYTASTAFLFGGKKYAHPTAMWTSNVENELSFRIRDL